jgi:hypothetical protein
MKQNPKEHQKIRYDSHPNPISERYQPVVKKCEQDKRVSVTEYTLILPVLKREIQLCLYYKFQPVETTEALI